MKTVTLVCGIPNAGKTTYCKSFDNVIHLDDFKDTVFKRKFDKCSYEAIHSDNDVCIDGCYHLKFLRKELLDGLSKQDCKKICIWINTNLDTCLSRDGHIEDEDTVKGIASMFEPPEKDEGWDEIIVISE